MRKLSKSERLKEKLKKMAAKNAGYGKGSKNNKNKIQ